MRLGDQQVVREALGAHPVGLVEVLDRDAEARRVAADVVEREQPPVAVEGGVLDALGHDRRRRLLEAGDERVPAALAQQEHVGERRGEPRLGNRLAVLVLHPARPRLHVGPVHGQRGDGAVQPADLARRLAGEPLQLGDERGGRLLALGLVGVGAERAGVAGDLLPQRGQRRLARRVDVERRDVVEELVADRALHRPVAQLLAGVEDLLDPHVARAAVAQPAQVAGRVGEPVRVVDAQAVDRCPRAPAPERACGSRRTPPRPPGGRPPGGRCRRSAASGRSPRRGRSSAAAGPGRSSSGWRRRSPCGWGRCRGSARARPRGPRGPARRTRARRPARARSTSGRRRRSRAWSPRRAWKDGDR